MAVKMKYSSKSPHNIVYATRKPQPTRHGRQRSNLAALAVGLAALVIILPLIFVSGTIIFFQTQQLNLPYVFIFNRDVGFVSTQETADLVDSDWNQNRTIILVDSKNTEIQFQLAPQDLGIWVNPQATAMAAYDIGRSSQPFDDVLTSLRGQSHIIFPVLYFDHSRARATLQSIAEKLETPSVEAAVIYQDGQWIASPGAVGQTVDMESTLERLSEDPFSILLEGSLPLYVHAVPPKVADLSPLLDQIESLVSEEISLKAYDPIREEHHKWSVPVEEKTSWVSVDAETNQIKYQIAPEDIQALFSTWTHDLGEGRSFVADLNYDDIILGWDVGNTPLVMIHHDPTTYHVSQGESLWSISLKLGMPLWYIIEANPGLNIDNIAVGMELNIPSKNILTPLPVVMDKRIVVDISSQRMTVYENGQVRNTHIVSTGIEDSPTMAGIFQVQSHSLNAYASNWDLYMPHFIGIYEAWPGFMNGIHGLPTLSSGRRLWAGNLGTPVSYGCIILTLDAAEDLYHWAELGVIVEITR